jgi:hypothetical protein
MKTALFAALLGLSSLSFGQTATPIPDTPPAKPPAAAPAKPAAAAPAPATAAPAPQATVTVKPAVPPKPMNAARKAKRDEDARHCLDKESNTEIIKCAEAYL